MVGDVKLDKLAWKKAKDECDRGIAYIVKSLQELVNLFGEDVVLAVRRAIWERHGNASEWSVRVIGDSLAGLQNHASSYCSVHRPATHDDVVAQIIAVREMVSAALVLSWTSDFAKAYRQVPQLMEQLKLTVVVQHCPETNAPVFIVSYGQLFGGKTPPQNFSRQPSWWCYVMAPLIGLPLQHTVDDVIATERKEIAVCGNDAWREITALTGWDIPDSKSPPPAETTCVLGADIRHDAYDSEIDVTELRAETLRSVVYDHIQKDNLGAGAAGKLYGRFSATNSQSHGCYGRAKLGPIKKRQYEHGKSHLTRQLISSLWWWYNAMANRVPRPVPFGKLRRSDPVIT